jgi:hypothetical protein
MRSERLPLRGIPGTSKLFADFVSDYAKVSRWYARSPGERSWMAQHNPENPADRPNKVA